MTDPRPNLIGGEWRTSDRIVDVHFPYNDDVVAQIYLASDQDIEDAIAASVRGFEITRKLPSHARSQILYNLLDQMEQRTNELVEALMIEGGMTRVSRGWGYEIILDPGKYSKDPDVPADDDQVSE